MTVAIGVLCIFLIVTLRDDYLMHREEQETRELQERFRPHEQYYFPYK